MEKEREREREGDFTRLQRKTKFLAELNDYLSFQHLWKWVSQSQVTQFHLNSLAPPYGTTLQLLHF